MASNNEKVVRWGILGVGRIAERFARSLSHVAGAELVAASFRSAEKAAAFARAHGLDPSRCYADELLSAPGAAHEALLADADVDVIYLALPHGLHHLWSVAALRAGKAVLCEKPAALSAEEMTDIARVAREEGVLFMEAMKTRFVPLYSQVRALVDAGAVGEVLRVETALMNDMGARISERTDYLSDPVSGGGLYDTGIYCASWLEDVLGALGTPELSSLDLRLDAGVDSFVDAELRFGGAAPAEAALPVVPARLVCATDSDALPNEARIVGTRGTLVVERLHRPERARLLTPAVPPRELVAPYDVDDFFGELVHVCNLVRAGRTESDVMPLAASIRCAEIIDVIRAGFPAAQEAAEEPAAAPEPAGRPFSPAPAPAPAEKDSWRTRVLCTCGRRDPERF